MQFTMMPIFLLLSVVLVAGCTNGAQPTGGQTLPDGSVQKADGTVVKPDGTMIKPDGTIVKPDGTMVLPDGTMILPEPSGPDNGGTDAQLDAFDNTGLEMIARNYYRFDPAAFQQAKDKGYAVFLDFHANWCPICNAEKPHILAAFNDLPYQDVIGFEVHYNDDKTQAFDTAAAQEYQVPYQHTKVLLGKDGTVVKKTLQGYGSAADVTADIDEARAA